MSDLFFSGEGGPSSQAFLQALIELVTATNAQTQTFSGTLSAPFTGDVSGTPPGPIQVIATHLTAPLPYSQGGTGLAAYSAGQLLIGNGIGGLTAASLTAPAAGLSITGGAGSITFALANDLAALEAMSGTGIVSRTATETYAQRTIAGTLNRIAVSNGDAVAGNPTIDISGSYVGQTSITTLGVIGAGTWQATVVGLAYGGTGANLSASGGTSQVLRQSTVGGTIAVSQLAASDLSNGTTGSGSVVLATAPTLSGVVTFGGTGATVPALKRSTTILQTRLGDDSAFASMQGKLTTDTNYTAVAPAATGYLTIYDATGTAYKVLCAT